MRRLILCDVHFVNDYHWIIDSHLMLMDRCLYKDESRCIDRFVPLADCHIIVKITFEPSFCGNMKFADGLILNMVCENWFWVLWYIDSKRTCSKWKPQNRCCKSNQLSSRASLLCCVNPSSYTLGKETKPNRLNHLTMATNIVSCVDGSCLKPTKTSLAKELIKCLPWLLTFGC